MLRTGTSFIAPQTSKSHGPPPSSNCICRVITGDVTWDEYRDYADELAKAAGLTIEYFYSALLFRSIGRGVLYIYLPKQVSIDEYTWSPLNLGNPLSQYGRGLNAHEKYSARSSRCSAGFPHTKPRRGN